MLSWSLKTRLPAPCDIIIVLSFLRYLPRCDLDDTTPLVFILSFTYLYKQQKPNDIKTPRITAFILPKFIPACCGALAVPDAYSH